MVAFEWNLTRISPGTNSGRLSEVLIVVDRSSKGCWADECEESPSSIIPDTHKKRTINLNAIFAIDNSSP
jgi:hypothetical protein